MTLEKILSIGGKPGLYKLITQTRGGFVAESLLDKKRVTVNLRSNVSVLSEIAIYTLEEELPLRAVFLKIQEKEEGGKTAISHKDDKIKLEEYFFEILPNYDEDRVYTSDIKKVIQWYNILVDNEITDFSDKKSTDKEEKPVDLKSTDISNKAQKVTSTKGASQSVSGKKAAQKNPAARKK